MWQDCNKRQDRQTNLSADFGRQSVTLKSKGPQALLRRILYCVFVTLTKDAHAGGICHARATMILFQNIVQIQKTQDITRVV